MLRAEGPLAPTRVREILRQVADALAAAASIGVLHRDLKPANVLIEQGSERVLLADFGIAAALIESPQRIDRVGPTSPRSRIVETRPAEQTRPIR